MLLDEVEALAVSRTGASLETNPVDVHRATDAVLAGVDHVSRACPNVTFVATTNHAAGVDVAFLSRADLIEEIGYPGAEAIGAILRDTLRELAPGVDEDEARLTELAAACAAASMDARQVRKLVLRAPSRAARARARAGAAHPRGRGRRAAPAADAASAWMSAAVDLAPKPSIPRESILLAGSMFLLIAATNILTPLLPGHP